MARHPVVAFLREIVDEWQHDGALNLGAALAYYTLFAMAPLLVLVIAIAGFVERARAPLTAVVERRPEAEARLA